MSGAIRAAQLVVILPLLARRRWPFPVLLVVSTASVATSLSIETAAVPVAAVALASFTVGERGGDRVRSAMGVIAVAGFIALGFIVQDADPFEALVLPFVVVVPSWLVGDVVRTRRLDAATRQAEAMRAAQENEARLRTAVAEERRAMARELHDVVAHGVSVMLIQSGAARQVIRTSPDLAEEALLTVEATGREAMAELRRMLGVLNDDGEATGLAPQPGVDQLGALVERVREAGLPTELSIDGSPRPLPASLDVTVYRIVQEALTNALRYARRAATLVHLSYEHGPAQAGDPRRRSGRRRRRSRRERAGSRRDAAAGGPGRGSPGGGAAARGRLRGPGVVAAGAGTRVTGPSLRVLIVDDQALVRAGFRMILEAQPDIEVIGEAADGETAIRLSNRLRPDIVLMDVRMPGLDGLETTRRLLGDTSRPAPRIVILTTFDLDEYVYAAMQAGASGFLLKDVSAEQLVAAVRTVSVGDALLAPSITRRLVERFARPDAALAIAPEAVASLTAQGTRGLPARGARHEQRRDRGRAGRHRSDGQDSCGRDPGKAGPPEPCPGGRVRLRIGSRPGDCPGLTSGHTKRPAARRPVGERRLQSSRREGGPATSLT